MEPHTFGYSNFVSYLISKYVEDYVLPLNAPRFLASFQVRTVDLNK